MKSKKLCLFLCVLLVASVFAGCSGGGGEASKEPIKVGMTCALSGGPAIWGQGEKEAIEMEIEKINAAGGVLGRPLELIVYDNKADQVEGINVAKRLIGEGVAFIIGPSQSGVAMAMESVTEPAGIPFISASATNPKVTVDPLKGLMKTAFRACFIDPFQGKVAAQFAMNDLSAKKAAILYNIGSDYSQGLVQFFEEEFTKNGGTIVAKEAFPNGELDYRAMLGKIKDSNPDVLFIPVMQNEAGLAMKQARDLGMTCTFLGGDGWASPELVQLGGPATEGSYYINLLSQEDPSIQDFLNEYKTKYGKDPVLPNLVLAVDGLYAMVNAIEKAESTDPAKIIEQLEQTTDLPVLSGNLTIDPATHNPVNKPAVIETVKDGQLVFFKKFVTE